LENKKNLWPTDEEYLKRLLSIYWLRPETALARAEDCIFVRDYCREYLERGKNIEMGCGNGLLSFIMAGGKIDFEYDVFLDVDNPELYSTTPKDIFDKISDRKVKFDDSLLKYSYDYGVDWKEGLLSQSGRYSNLYKKVLQADLNQAVQLEKKYDTIFCNMLYWLNDPQEVLEKWGSLLKENGKIILFLTNQNFKDRGWLYYKAPHKGTLDYLNYFDRGYGEMSFKDFTKDQWEEIFKKAGYSVEKCVNARNDTIMNIWNIGTRPIASPIMIMAEKLGLNERREVKKYWVDFFYEFFKPIIEKSKTVSCKDENCSYYFYVLNKIKQ
jgi:SAM-dependent methyltransferase